MQARQATVQRRRIEAAALCCGLVGGMLSAPAAAQVPRTPWGDPDLQGIYTTDAERSVPMERSEQFGERRELTAEELAARADAEERLARDDKHDGPPRDETGPKHWFEYADRPSARTSLVIDPPDGRIPPLTLGAQTRAIDPDSVLGFVGGAFDGTPLNGPEDFNLGERCITRGLPHTWFPSAYNNGFQIVQSPGQVAILYERLHEHRLIPLDGRAALTENVRQWFGDSRGYWDGDTLVVEVTNFSDRTNYKGAGATLRLLERYTRVDADTIEVAITIDDPATWTRPWTFMMTGKRDPTYWQIFEYACHEANYGLSNILSIQRNLEQAERENAAAATESRGR